MTTATLTQNDTLRNYFADVSNAARAFSAALFAAQERQYVAQVVVKKAAPSERTLRKGRTHLFSMARKYEDHSPSMASELRNLASRG
jgi:hypothetical protein